MVVFTCNNCGESLAKPKVAKHYQFQCRSSENLTCVDCHKDFYGLEYVAHTKCITESERYGGKDFVARPGQNKGERKQQEWINVVKNVFDTAINLTRDEQNLLNILSKHENIPRKKAKFLNFIRSVTSNRVNPDVTESVWSRMETAFKDSVEQSKKESEANTNGNQKQDSESKQSSPVKNHENNIAENENNENICRENENTVENGTETKNDVGGKKKKLKKRNLVQSEVEQADQPVIKKEKKKIDENTVEPAITVNNHNNEDKTKFDWKNTILEIVTSKQEISLKKLRKRVVNRYVNHCANAVTLEKGNSRFDKKLSKITELTVNDDVVKLA